MEILGKIHQQKSDTDIQVQDVYPVECCFSFVASESSFFVGQTFWSSLSFFVGMLTFGDLDDCRYYMGWF
ncbi:hypothetical protein GLOIN_2v383112 [Rhizophagus irregularis DAOM 181602=DAOM 197198]|nr:hypothetical protein GLOIN_2v383112 [Rhizophagus irregularis DAOM 181602=DAOM 197198]